MKRHLILAMAVLIAVSASACSNAEKAVMQRVKPVRTIEVKEQVSPAVLNYTGIVGSGELKKLAFKSTGKIGRINVEEGQKVQKGDVILELDGQDLQYALAAAKGQAEAARAVYEKALKGATAEELNNAELNVKKAQDAYDYIMNNYKRMEALFKSDAVSQNEFEKIKLEADVKESELKQAKELLTQVRNGARREDKKALLNQLEQAEADYEYKASLVKDAAMAADCDGYIVDVLYEKGELVPAGYPVAVIRSEGLVVNVGLSGEDFGKVALGTTAKVSIGEKLMEGKVTNISQVPDDESRTYNAEISLDETGLNIGTVVKVQLVTGNEKGIWIPLTSMLSDGMDYVYLAKDNTAEKREVVIEGMVGSTAKVKGLKPGEQLIVEGMKRLRAGDAVSVLK